jgi:hypothetical protein
MQKERITKRNIHQLQNAFKGASMKAKHLIGLIICFTISCSQKKTADTKNDVPSVINEIAELPEFKTAEKRIDSLKASGVNVDIQIIVLPDAIQPEDSANISTAYIEENYGFDQNELYEIKFNKLTQKIISIEKTGSNPLSGGAEKIKKVPH